MTTSQTAEHDKSSQVDPFQTPLMIGVVGHRDLAPAELPAMRAAVDELLRGLQRAHPDVRGTLLTSMADGADLMAAEVAAALGFQIIAVLPFKAEKCRAELQTDEARATFDRILRGAERLEIGGSHAEPHGDDGKIDAWRESQFQRAGFIVAHYSSLLVAIWDGKETGKEAGTARVIEYRVRGHVANHEDDSLTGNVLLAGHDNDLIFDIRCSRASSSGPQGTAGLPRVIGYVGHGVENPAEMPAALRAILSRTAEFNRDVQENRSAIQRSGVRLSLPSPTPIPERLTYLDHLFRASDWLGRKYRRSFTLALRTRYLLWFAMALLLLSFKKHNDEAGGFAAVLGVLAVFVLGAVLALWAHRKSWHRKYLDYRALAEGLRVDFYWEIAGVRSQFGGEFAHESFLQKQDVDLEWIRSAMRSVSLRLAVRRGAPPHGGFEQAYAGWVGEDDRANGYGQLRYYGQRIHVLERTIRFQEHVSFLLLVGGLVLAGAFAVELWMSPDHQATLPHIVRLPMEWALTGLTVFAGVFDTYVTQKADFALVRQYRYMYSLFSVAARELRVATTEARKLEILKALGHACLAEHAQWILAYRDRRIEGLKW